ncbi:MAG: hypothetical protein ACXQTM_04950 [Methanosarcinales archaeon]
MDESSIRLNPKRRSVINTPIVRYRERKRRSKLISGFIALNGNDVVMLSNSRKSDDMIASLELIRNQNPDKPFCIVLENARIHHAKTVKIRAEELDIHSHKQVQKKGHASDSRVIKRPCVELA